MDINDSDLTPARPALSERAPAPASAGGPVASFTLTRATHPDEIWQPRGSEIAPPGRPLGRGPDHYARAESQRPVPAVRMGELPLEGSGLVSAHHAIRAAVRPAS